MKHYTLTESEQLLVRDALVEEFVRLRDHLAKQSDPSPRACQRLRELEALKTQFQDDCRK